jgi:hypothetical protein
MARRTILQDRARITMVSMRDGSTMDMPQRRSRDATSKQVWFSPKLARSIFSIGPHWGVVAIVELSLTKTWMTRAQYRKVVRHHAISTLSTIVVIKIPLPTWACEFAVVINQKQFGNLIKRNLLVQFLWNRTWVLVWVWTNMCINRSDFIISIVNTIVSALNVLSYHPSRRAYSSHGQYLNQHMTIHFLVAGLLASKRNISCGPAMNH